MALQQFLKTYLFLAKITSLKVAISTFLEWHLVIVFWCVCVCV